MLNLVQEAGIVEGCRPLGGVVDMVLVGVQLAELSERQCLRRAQKALAVIYGCQLLENDRDGLLGALLRALPTSLTM